MTQIIKFPKQPSNVDKEFSEFVDDFGGFVYSIKAVTHESWAEVARRCGVSISTLHKIANRNYTRGPALSTFYKVARALDERSIIKHSLYMKWRGFDRKAARALDKALIK